MGMIANYQAISNAELEKIFSADDVEELQKNQAVEICDIDTMWDALHFLLTGQSASEPLVDNLLSEGIVGQFNISPEGVEEFVAGILSDRVKEIAQAWQKVDFDQYSAKFNMANFAQNDIYPDIWAYEDEADLIKEDLRGAFISLKEFYTKMAEQDKAVLVSIY